MSTSETMMGYSHMVFSSRFRCYCRLCAHLGQFELLCVTLRFSRNVGGRRAVCCCYHSPLGETKGSMMRVLLGLLLLPLSALAEDFKLNSQEYFERPGINVMYGQDYY